MNVSGQEIKEVPKQISNETTAYLVGSGIASLASAFYLIQDAGLPGKNIHIMEQRDVAGGALDGAWEEEEGYVIRGGRMHEDHYVCYWDLLSQIPSLEDPKVSVADECKAFNAKYVSNAKARLMRNGEILDVSSYGLSKSDQAAMLKLWFAPEMLLGDKRIEDWFSAHFFKSNFWLLWTSMFAFQKWSSLMEMRRYFIRFIHLLPGMNKLEKILRTKYNQYDSVVLPLRRWLEGKGVIFEMQHQVTNIEFDLSADKKHAHVIHYRHDGAEKQIMLGELDYVFITNGSIVEAADTGSMEAPPRLNQKPESGAWALWEKIAAQHEDFGNPGVFCDDIDLQKWESFTVTLEGQTFHDHMEQFSGNISGTGGLVTFTDSNWLMSVVIAAQPHFANQPPGVTVFWGYGLYPDREGNHIQKKMSECSGREILDELWYHLKIADLMQPLVDAGKVTCLPVMMPFIDSLFMPRESGDRPDVIPEGAANFAFLGQFAEVPHDCVFTVEYSVRCAQMAVYGLFDTGKKTLPIYKGHHDPVVLANAVQALNR
jgi:oleate hydratase